MRKAAHCPNGHKIPPEDINGLVIKCTICDWLDDSAFEDIMYYAEVVKDD